MLREKEIVAQSQHISVVKQATVKFIEDNKVFFINGLFCVGYPTKDLKLSLQKVTFSTFNNKVTLFESNIFEKMTKKLKYCFSYEIDFSHIWQPAKWHI